MRQKLFKNFLFFTVFLVGGLAILGEAQEIINKGETFYVKNGESLELLCHIKDVEQLVNDEAISVAWSLGHDTGLIASDLEVQDESKDYRVSVDKDYYKLLIPSITLSDDKKTFVCTSYSDGAPYSITHNVFIGETPAATFVGKKDKTIAIGQEFVLECQVTGTPSPIVEWTYEGGKIPKGVKIIGNKLVFEKAQLLYSGNYRCTANNSIGSSFTQSKINVVENIKIFNKSEQISAEFGKELNLTCKYIAYPEASVSWTFNGKPLHELVNENATKIYAYQEEKYTFSVLNIISFQISNIGQYKCYISNGKGSESKVINVIPIIPSIHVNINCNNLFFETPFKENIEKIHLYWKTKGEVNFSIIEIDKKNFSAFKIYTGGSTGVVKLSDLDIPKNALFDFEVVLETTKFGEFKSLDEVSGYVFDVENPGKLGSSKEYMDCFSLGLGEPSSGNSNHFFILSSTLVFSALLFTTFGNLMLMK
uniref:Ig-like domain-containing protein n=1 Tax=Strongyloides papillosus TaxID=174720 RepID=A0A0N5B1Y8_STREA